jgi:hypothetical protein
VIRRTAHPGYRPRGRVRSALGLLGFIVAGTVASPLSAQLRPYEPLEWSALLGPSTWVAHVGGGVFEDQRVSLAGTSGRLFEVGSFGVTGRSGRIALEVAGTARRVLRERERFRDADPLTPPAPSGTRSDVGDVRIGAALRVTGTAETPAVALRFGTRLPTTDNSVGLERDATDFFALAGTRFPMGPVALAAELGVGIHGTRLPDFEQSDVLVYLLGIEWTRATLVPALLLVGHRDGLDGWTVPGNESLSELRLRLRTGTRVWLRLEVVKGLARFSPSTGLTLAIGTTR